MRQLSQWPAQTMGVDEPVFGGFLGHLHSLVLHGRVDGLENSLMPEYQTHPYDVLIIGAGGAGLRAAIEASYAGVSVGVVSKSLLGKAHTVMAEGGLAAVIGNLDRRDHWNVQFPDP